MAEQLKPASSPQKPAPAPKPDRGIRLLEEMRANPKANWAIADVEKLCRHYGISCSSPSRGSHYKVSSDALTGALTIPAKRPIKPFYIKTLVSLIDAHLRVKEDQSG